MNIKRTFIFASTLAAVVVGATVISQAQSVTRGVPVQQRTFPGVQYQQGVRVQQGFQQPVQSTGTQYFNVNLSDAQKAAPNTGATYYDTAAGVAVRSIYTNGPAQKAGLNSGDIIMKVNDQAVTNSGSLNAMIAKMQPGSSIKFTKRSSNGNVSDCNCQLMTMGDIINASIVPEAGVYDNAVMKAEQMMKGLQQQISNAESELMDMKKRYEMQTKQMQDLKAKAEEARMAEQKRKAADEMQRQKRMEELKRQAEEAAKG